MWESGTGAQTDLHASLEDSQVGIVALPISHSGFRLSEAGRAERLETRPRSVRLSD